MKKILTVLAILGCISDVAATQCREYTEEQETLLNLAYHKGLPYDYAYTLAAIVQEEAFVGKRVIRINPLDKGGAYGVTQITLKTARDLTGAGHWEGRKIAEELVKDDQFAMDMGIRKLMSVRTRNFLKLWERYNGRGKAAVAYAKRVRGHVRQLKACHYFYPSNQLTMWRPEEGF